MSAAFSDPTSPSYPVQAGGEDTDDVDPVRLRTEQIAGLWSMLPIYGVNYLLYCAVVALMCWPVVEASRIAAWFATTALLAGPLVIAGRRLCGPARVAAHGPDRALRIYLVLCVAFALIQSSAAWWVVPSDPTRLLAYGMLIVAVLVGAPLQFGYVPAGLAFGGVVVVSLALRLFSLGDPFAIGVGVACLVFLAPYADSLFRARKAFLETYRARFRNESLARRLERSMAAELDARRAAQRADDAKTRFLAAASHDLRQPVHAGGLFVAALAAEPLPPRAAELAGTLGRTLSGLDELLGRLLDVSRFDAGQVPVEIGPVDVGDVVERVASRFAPLAREKGLAFRVRRGAPVHARSDAVLLGQIVANLVSNAVRHTARGGVLVGVRRRSGSVVIDVVDTGPGIPADRLDAIFEPFVQLGDAARDRREGLGLGLAIVRRFCERLGHACVPSSTLGRGTRFSVRLERLAGPVPDVPSRREDASPGGAADVAGALVLVVDDDVDVLAATDAALRGWGAETLLADSVVTALAAVDACERYPDVILADHRIGSSASGFDVVRRVAEATGQALPAIVMSADLDETLARRVAAQGAVLLRKPVDPRALRARVADACAAVRRGNAR